MRLPAKDTDILCAFRLVPHDSVEPIERGRGRRRIVHRHLDGGLDRSSDSLRALSGEVLSRRSVPGTNQYIVTSPTISICLRRLDCQPHVVDHRNVFGFKALKSLRLEDMRIPPHYTRLSRDRRTAS